MKTTMQTFYLVIFIQLLRVFHAEECDDASSCAAVSCETITDCPIGQYKYKPLCECCYSCATYLNNGDACTPDGIKCAAGSECDAESKTCHKIFLNTHCLRQYGECDNQPLLECKEEEVLPADVSKCRCCPMCFKDVDKNGIGCKRHFICDSNTGQCKPLLE